MRGAPGTGYTALPQRQTVTSGDTFASRQRAACSSRSEAAPGLRTFAQSENSRAEVLSRSASFPCPPFRQTFPFLYLPPRGNLVSISLHTGGSDVCIIDLDTQFVNRLIPFISKMHFMHDAFFTPGTEPCAIRGKAGLLSVLRSKTVAGTRLLRRADTAKKEPPHPVRCSGSLVWLVYSGAFMLSTMLMRLTWRRMPRQTTKVNSMVSATDSR